jgi:hypothetical protein
MQNSLQHWDQSMNKHPVPVLHPHFLLPIHIHL